MIANTLQLARINEKDQEWVNVATANITRAIDRTFINDLLVPTLLEESRPHSVLANMLREVCLEDIKKRTVVKPTPPSNWTRSVPQTKEKSSYYSRSYDKVWKMLTPFLQSPTEQVYRYTANQNLRDNVTSAIANTEVDLSHTTSKVGRPYTLILTKTQTAYEKDLNRWKEDMKLLETLE